jgi:Chloramphenicol phosphotransferase-like protein
VNGVLLLAGPPAVGHNTVAAILASSDSPVAVVDGDDLRAMVNHPAAPGSGPEWESQYDVCVRNLCAIAANFDHAGLTTILLDVVEPETVPLYRDLLADVTRFDLVLLSADDETLLARDRGRHPDAGAEPAGLEAWHQRITFLRSKLAASAHLYDHRIDTTRQSPEQTAQAVRAALS